MLQSWTFVTEDGNISYNTEAEMNTINTPMDSPAYKSFSLTLALKNTPPSVSAEGEDE